jgi:hypothetical protein
VIRLLRILILTCVAMFLAIGVMATYRAYYPVSSVTILLPEATIRPGVGIRVDTVSSGRGPVSVQVEIIQGTRSATVAIDRVSSRRWAFWDFRWLRHSTYSVVRSSVLQHFTSGPAVVRATVVGAPAWLRQPPPVVEEAAAQLQPDLHGKS